MSQGDVGVRVAPKGKSWRDSVSRDRIDRAWVEFFQMVRNSWIFFTPSPGSEAPSKTHERRRCGIERDKASFDHDKERSESRFSVLVRRSSSS
jgi:hypothetical protein